jgi:Tol biopolymer transport system component
VYFARGDNAIWQVDVSPRTGRRRGDPREVHTQIEALRDLTGRVEFSLTRDGRRMVYARGAQYSNIWVVDSSAAERKPRLTPLTTGTALRWSPVVSPDGRWIAFAQEANGVAELFRMSIDGGSASQLTFGARVWRRSWIAWSPDGRELAFTSVRAGRAHVWVVSLNGGQPRALERTRITTGATHLAWAPGARIAYQTPELNNIDLVDPQSGVVRSVGDTTFCCYYFPQYSPDGGRLAVFRQRPANHGIWVYRLRDSSWTQVADSMLFPRGWSADGRYVYAQLAWKQPLYRVEAADKRSPQHVVTAPFREVECAPAGPFRFGAFVCVAFDFVSDIWMIDSSNSRSP